MKQMAVFFLLAFLTPQAFAWALPSFPKPRPDTAPHIPSPYQGCALPLESLSDNELFDCAESEFWEGFSDGRLAVRKDTEKLLGKIMLLTWSSPKTTRKGRLHALRGYLRLALALENGRVEHLILGSMQSDFEKAIDWDTHNKIYDTFLDTIKMAKFAVFGDWKKATALAWPSFDILTEQPVNILALSGTTIGFPLDTGLPQKTIETLDAFVCDSSRFEFCETNTQRAPYARPGLNFHFAEAYARMGRREETKAYLEKARTSPGFEQWAYKALVLGPLQDLDA